MVPLGKLTGEERDIVEKRDALGDQGGELKNLTEEQERILKCFGEIKEIAGKKYIEREVSHNHRPRSSIAHLTRFNLFDNSKECD